MVWSPRSEPNRLAGPAALWGSSTRRALLVVLWTSALAPHGALAQTRPSVDYVVIGPGQESRVMALLAPWEDGAEVAPGVRWTGASIRDDRVCYQLETTHPLTACLTLRERLASLPASLRRDLPGDAVLSLTQPPQPDAEDARVFALLATRIEANAEAAGLNALWRWPGSRTAPSASGWAPAWFASVLTDPLLWMALVLLWLLIASARAVAELPGGGWPWVLGLLALSAWPRLTLAVRAPMNAWSWTRTTSLGDAVAASPSLHVWLEPHGGVFFDDLQSVAMRVVSIATPLAVLGHGRKLFGDARPALLAAALLAASPHAIRFAGADDQFTPSMFWSSTAFFWLYTALEARSLPGRILGLAGLVPLLALAFTARPLNLVYAPLMLAALAIAAQEGEWRWRLALAGCIAAVAGWTGWALWQSSAETVRDVAAWSSVQGALLLLLRPDYNPLLFWRLTPPVWLLLIGLGAAGLWRARWPHLAPTLARRRGVWLICWLFGYIVLHGVVVVDEPLNNARYQLHSLPAMAMLAGVGLWIWWGAWSADRLRRTVVVAAGVICLAAPWMHRAAIADTAFDVMQERAFLDTLRDQARHGGPVPAGCSVIEAMRPSAGAPASKFGRVGRLVGVPRARAHLWQSVEVQHWTERAARSGQTSGGAFVGIDGATAQASVAAARAIALAADRRERDPEAAELSDRGRAILARPAGCQVFYEGPECAVGPGQAGRFSACAEILASGRWQLVAERRHTTRVYDGGLSWHLREGGDPLTLRVWRRMHL